MNDNTRGEFFRQLASRKVERPAAPRWYILKVALVFGVTLGLAYGVSTQYINSMVSPAVPFSHHPFGIVGNCVASVFGFTLICVVCSLPKDFVRAALFGSLSLFFVLEVRALFTGTPLLAELVSLLSIFALIGIIIEIVLSIPVMLLLRWTIEMQTELFHKPLWSWSRLRFPLVFVAAAVGLGFFSLYPADARAAMENMTALITKGLAASGPNELPPALSNGSNVQDFLLHAQPPFMVELGEQSLFGTDISPLLHGYTIVTIARFSNGWAIACLYIDRPDQPICKSYDAPSAPPVTDYHASQLHRM